MTDKELLIDIRSKLSSSVTKLIDKKYAKHELSNIIKSIDYLTSILKTTAHVVVIKQQIGEPNE